jgi:hypothetical protein
MHCSRFAMMFIVQPLEEFHMSHPLHDHSPENTGQSMAFSEKARKLIVHWSKHNDDHAQSYRQWADKFRENGLTAAAARLESAAVLTEKINNTLSEALQHVDRASE